MIRFLIASPVIREVAGRGGSRIDEETKRTCDECRCREPTEDGIAGIWQGIELNFAAGTGLARPFLLQWSVYPAGGSLGPCPRVGRLGANLLFGADLLY